MAELIPVRYRLRIATRHRVERWVILGVLMLAVCAGAVVSAYAWQQRAQTRLLVLKNEHQARAQLIVRSQELRAKRQELAERMRKIQHIMDDRVLLSLLHNISLGFGASDSLDYIHIDAQPQDAREPAAFVVNLSGITANSSSLAQLMTRLGQKTQPAVNVQLQSSHREAFLDGQVMRFQITCEHAATPKG